MGTFGKCKGGGRRSASRSPAPLIAAVTTLKGAHSAIVVNVSSTGARLRGANLPDLDEQLFVNLDGVIAFGTVAWSDADEMGVAFDGPLSGSDEQRLNEKVKAAGGLPAEIKAAFDQWTLGVAR